MRINANINAKQTRVVGCCALCGAASEVLPRALVRTAAIGDGGVFDTDVGPAADHGQSRRGELETSQARRGHEHGFATGAGPWTWSFLNGGGFVGNRIRRWSWKPWVLSSSFM